MDSVPYALCVNRVFLDRLSSEEEDDDTISSDEEDGHNAWDFFLDAVVQDEPGMLVEGFLEDE